MAIFGIYVKFQRDFPPTKFNEIRLWKLVSKRSRFFSFLGFGRFSGASCETSGGEIFSNSAPSFSHFLQHKIIQASPSSDSQSICTPWNTQQKTLSTPLWLTGSVPPLDLNHLQLYAAIAHLKLWMPRWRAKVFKLLGFAVCPRSTC